MSLSGGAGQKFIEAGLAALGEGATVEDVAAAIDVPAGWVRALAQGRHPLDRVLEAVRRWNARRARQMTFVLSVGRPDQRVEVEVEIRLSVPECNRAG